MRGTTVWLVLAVTNFAHQQVSSSDGSFECPPAWTETVTLKCNVAFNSLSKCAINVNSTFFEVERGGGKTISCAVSAANYATCNFVPGSTTGCGCTKSTTHYIFLYRIINATGNAYRGDWGCSKTCSDNNGDNPLVITTSGTCRNDGPGPGTSLVPPTLPGAPDGDDGGGLSNVEIAAIVASVVIVIIIVGIIIALFVKGIGPFKKT